MSVITTTITYTYDPLYRLAAADYSDGGYFHYTYDAVGNRLTETTLAGTTNYVYDIANRLSSVNGVNYTWDDNGNLLNDGVNTYGYDNANRLTSVVQGSNTYTYAYNGLGDRLRQTVNSVPTNYTVDLVARLTQVLTDGTNSYLYGVVRIGEQQPGGWLYHLGDAIGSVRQLTDNTGIVVLSKSYQPYGEVLSGSGTGASSYGFTGEWGDTTGLTYLRSRYYASKSGRFLTKDPWQGYPTLPLSLNNWLYAFADPVNKVDPSGSSPFFPPICLTANSQTCVDVARWQYSKTGPIWLAGLLWGGRYDCTNLAWSKPVNARELLTDYICERGPVSVSFWGHDTLTKELANAIVMDELRKRYYQEGDIPKPGESNEFRFNLPEYGRSLEDVLISGEPFPIMHFLGSFEYTVYRRNYGRVHFQISNRTDLASGTHIPFRWPPESQIEDPLSLEEVIDENWMLRYVPASFVLATFRDNYGNPIVSLLKPLTRHQTGGLGGGIMEQVFSWSERYLTCGLERLPWPDVLDFIDVR
jgi:RHS repeat-associated protein